MTFTSHIADVPGDQVAISCEDVTISYGSFEAVKGVFLSVPRGQVTAFIGPSGCGKSTLLRLIADLDTPSSGSVEVFGTSAHQARVDQKYGIAFQQAGLLP